jgi:hypothetical protein
MAGDHEKQYWIVDEAVAYVDSGIVTLQIDTPRRKLPMQMAQYVADPIWFGGQMRELEVARQRGETKVIPLTDRRRRSSLRLGGGFMITQGNALVVVRRGQDAPRRPGQLCECGGVFEVAEVPSSGNPGPEPDRDSVGDDYVAALLKECAEIAIVIGGTLCIPQLPPSPPFYVSKRSNSPADDRDLQPPQNAGFQPPCKLDFYNRAIEQELLTEAERARIPYVQGRIAKFWMKALDYERAVKLQFGYSPELSVEITAEIDTSSLECIGVLSFPNDVAKAVRAHLVDMKVHASSERYPNIGQFEKEAEDEVKPLNLEQRPEYWDTETRPSSHRVERIPLDRDIHIIDTEQAASAVWSVAWPAGIQRPPYEEEERFEGWPKRLRTSANSDLWTELSATRLGNTEGRFATEKLEKAIRMHCPFPRLQPLVRL